MLGAGAGPFAMGLTYDVTGSYQLMLAVFAIALLMASGLMLGLGSYVYPSGSQGSRNEGHRRAGFRLPCRRWTARLERDCCG